VYNQPQSRVYDLQMGSGYFLRPLSVHLQTYDCHCHVYQLLLRTGMLLSHVLLLLTHSEFTFRTPNKTLLNYSIYDAESEICLYNVKPLELETRKLRK